MAACGHICQRGSLRDRGPGLRSSLRYVITAERRTIQSRPGFVPSIVPVCRSRVSCRFDKPLTRDASATVTYSSSGNQPSRKCDRHRQYRRAASRPSPRQRQNRSLRPWSGPRMAAVVPSRPFLLDSPNQSSWRASLSAICLPIHRITEYKRRTNTRIAHSRIEGADILSRRPAAAPVPREAVR